METEFIFSDYWLKDRETCKTAIRSIVKEWRQKLQLQEWKFKTNFYRETYMASCYAEPEYFKGWLNFYLKRILEENQTNYELEEIVVHEMLHCLSWGLVDFTERLIEHAGDETGILEKSKNDHEESLIQKISNGLVMAKYNLKELPDSINVKIAGWEGISKKRG